MVSLFQPIDNSRQFIIPFNVTSLNIPIEFCAEAACNALAFTCIGFPSGLIMVTMFPKISLTHILSSLMIEIANAIQILKYSKLKENVCRLIIEI